MAVRAEPEWLIGGEPREVQLEALRRSYYGVRFRDSKNDAGDAIVIRPDARPAQGWGHLLEMRLGKTPTILNEFELFNRDYGVNKLVVISPNSYKEDWESECEKYRVSVPALAYEQSKLPIARQFVQKAVNGFVIVVNYEATYYDQTLEFLGSFIDNKTMIAADESIKLKNPNGLFFKSAMLLRKNAGVTRIATGLPITQGPQDFYAQGRFIGMFDRTNFYAYRGRYCKMGGFKAKKVVGTRNEDKLRAEIDANAFVAKRRDWGHLSEAEYFTTKVPMDPVQRRHYAEIEHEFLTCLEDGTEVSAEQVMSKMMKMQQISSGFIYTEDGRAVEIMDPRKTPKMKRLIELLEDEASGKVIIPFHYAKSGDMLMEVLAKYNPSTIRGDQWMRANDRDVVTEKRRFNSDPSSRVMVLQIAAGKYGHDLTGSPEHRCGIMVFFENSYSLDDRTQIEARNTTAFQEWSNIYIDLVSSSVEKRAVAALVNKEAVAEAVLGAYREDKTRRDIL